VILPPNGSFDIGLPFISAMLLAPNKAIMRLMADRLLLKATDPLCNGSSLCESRTIFQRRVSNVRCRPEDQAIFWASCRPKIARVQDHRP
jgi:hypothetical protein